MINIAIIFSPIIHRGKSLNKESWGFPLPSHFIQLYQENTPFSVSYRVREAHNTEPGRRLGGIKNTCPWHLSWLFKNVQYHNQTGRSRKLCKGLGLLFCQCCWCYCPSWWDHDLFWFLWLSINHLLITAASAFIWGQLHSENPTSTREQKMKLIFFLWKLENWKPLGKHILKYIHKLVTMTSVFIVPKPLPCGTTNKRSLGKV